MLKLIPVFSMAGIIPVFLISVFFQPENKYGIFLTARLIRAFSSPKINTVFFHAQRINTVFIFALDSRWTAGGQSKWTEWTEVCPPWVKKVQ